MTQEQFFPLLYLVGGVLIGFLGRKLSDQIKYMKMLKKEAKGEVLQKAP